MSEHEDMLRWWTITLMAVLHGFAMAHVQMELVGQGKKSVEALTEGVRDMMRAYTPEQKSLVARQLAGLSGLAAMTARFEPPS